MKRVSLSELNSPLLQQWNHERNQALGLYPNQTTPKSNKKVWWICSEGHEWQAMVANRTKGNGCPYCAGQMVLSGYNDLATKDHTLAGEWNYGKNGELTPSDVLPQSNMKVWWVCSLGHEWESTIANRTNGNGCPYCSGKKVLPGYNDLATINPDLAKEWHPYKNGDLLPSHVRPHMAKKVWWKCSKEHEWQATVDSRSSGSGCPFCNPQTSFAEQAILYYVKQAFPDTISRDTHLGIELDIYIPSMNSAVEYDGFFWHKSKEKTLLDREKNALCLSENIRLIRVRDVGLPDLTDCLCITRHNKKTDASLEQAIREVLHVLGEDWDVVNIERDRSSILSGFRSGNLKNSLELICPDLVKEWHPAKNGELTPADIPYGSSYPAWWICSKGHEWQAPVNRRTANKSGCPVCDNLHRKGPMVSYGKSLKKWCIDNHKEFLLDEYSNENPWSTEEVSPHSGYKVRWKCSQGHEWEATLGNRTSGSSCPYCSGRLAIPGINDLKTLRSDLETEWNYEKNANISPAEVTLKSNKKVWWKCTKGHEWQAVISNRTRGNGCPICRKLKK